MLRFGREAGAVSWTLVAGHASMPRAGIGAPRWSLAVGRRAPGPAESRARSSQNATADAAASDNALSPWLWAGIAVVAACALTALGVYRVRLARKDAQAEADQ